MYHNTFSKLFPALIQTKCLSFGLVNQKIPHQLIPPSQLSQQQQQQYMMLSTGQVSFGSGNKKSRSQSKNKSSSKSKDANNNNTSTKKPRLIDNKVKKVKKTRHDGNNKNNGKESTPGPSSPTNVQYVPFGLAPLSASDKSTRVKFASGMLELLSKDPSMIHRVVFSDEGNFWPFVKQSRTSEMISRPPPDSNKNNGRKLYSESRPLPTICWAGITTKEVIGPYFFNSHVTASSYLTMLRKFLLPQLIRHNFNLSSTWFQQDGAPPHRSDTVMSFLNDTFGSRLISYYSKTTELTWPSRSQDLTPLDYFFWDYMKSKMKIYTPKSRDNLRECLAYEMESIDPEVLEKFLHFEFIGRLKECLRVDGGRFDWEVPRLLA